MALDVLGLVLAGGLARRMGGGDKARIRIGDKTILERVLARLAPQCDAIILNANGDPGRFADTGLPVVAELGAGFRRPARRHPGRARLGGGERTYRDRHRQRAGRLPVSAGRSGGEAGCRARSTGEALACARSGDWRHPVAGLWPVALRADLRKALVDDGLHKIEIWTSRHGVAIADWPTAPVDPFFNVNTPEDAAEAGRLAALHRDL